jgi:hypothetical protein
MMVMVIRCVALIFGMRAGNKLHHGIMAINHQSIVSCCCTSSFKSSVVSRSLVSSATNKASFLLINATSDKAIVGYRTLPVLAWATDFHTSIQIFHGTRTAGQGLHFIVGRSKDASSVFPSGVFTNFVFVLFLFFFFLVWILWRQ